MEIRMNETLKHWFDALSVGGIVATLLGWIPHFTAVVTLIWVVMRAIEGMPKFLDACDELSSRWQRYKNGPK